MADISIEVSEIDVGSEIDQIVNPKEEIDISTDQVVNPKQEIEISTDQATNPKEEIDISSGISAPVNLKSV